MEISSNRKKIIISAIVMGSFGVAYGGAKSVAKSMQKLETEFMKNVKPEYFSYLNSDELQSVQKLLNKGMTKKELNMFSRIWKIPDKKQFLEEALDIFIGDTGYKYLKPKLTYDTSDDEGFFRWTNFSINIPRLEKRSKVDILGVLKHEIVHFKQYVSMLRTEGIGAEGILENEKENIFNRLKNDAGFMKNKSESEAKLIANYYNYLYRDILFVREQIALESLGSIPANSAEGKKAREYLAAFKNYVSVNRFSDAADVKKYEENLLEHEAFSAGDALADKYGDFILTLAEDKKKLNSK